MMFRHRDIPTVDIYFRQPLADLIAERGMAITRRPIKRIGPTTFLCRDRAVILRYITQHERRLIERHRPAALHYLLDDDLFALSSDTSLPADYRNRLEQFSSEHLSWIVAHATEIIAPSQSILDRFPRHRGELLQPAYTALCQDFEHFANDDVTRILFPGTRSHIADLEPLAEDLRGLVERNHRVSVTTYLGVHAPSPLTGHPRIENHPALKWPRYRKALRTSRFHIAIVPNRETAFNNARSINKIFDVAAVGAAGIYSNRPPSSHAITNDIDGLLLEDDPAKWLAAIERLANDRRTLRRLAIAGGKLAKRLGAPDRIRTFWLQRLMPERIEERDPGRPSIVLD